MGKVVVADFGYFLSPCLCHFAFCSVALIVPLFLQQIGSGKGGEGRRGEIAARRKKSEAIYAYEISLLFAPPPFSHISPPFPSRYIAVCRISPFSYDFNQLLEIGKGRDGGGGGRPRRVRIFLPTAAPAAANAITQASPNIHAY